MSIFASGGEPRRVHRRQQCTVAAIESDTGREVGVPASTGASSPVGSDGRFAAVVTREANWSLDAGKPAWRKVIGTMVVTAPLVAGERVPCSAWTVVSSPTTCSTGASWCCNAPASL
jgi:hypothetical protein